MSELEPTQLPPGIRKHRAGYQVDVQEGGKRKRFTVATLKEALTYRSLMRAEMIAAQPAVGKTLQDAYDQALREQWSRSKSERSKQGTLYNANIALTFFGPNTPISAITRTDIAAFDEYLKQRGDSDSTINRKHAPLSTMLTIALEHGWIDRKPVIKHFEEGEGRIRYLSTDEERLLLAQFEHWGAKDHYDVLCCLIDTGMRHSELWRLTVDCCDLTWINPSTNERQGLIHLWRTKTSLPRSLPMTSRVYDIINRRRINAKDGKLFHFGTDNAANKWFLKLWDRAKMMVGIKDDTLVPYCCRHTCATRLLQRGMGLPELQQWLGHKDIKMTMRYSHLAPTALVVGARLLERKELTS